MLKYVYLYLKNNNIKLNTLHLKNIVLADKEALNVIKDKKNSILITDDADIAWGCDMPFLFYLCTDNMNKSLPSGAYCVEVLEDLDDDYLIRVYKRYWKLPWKIMETDRLSIEEITVDDVPRLKELYNAPEITMYMEDLFPIEEEIEYTRSYIDNVYAFYGYGMWVMKLKDTGDIIGRVGIESKEGFDGLELGFMLGKDFWHNGYAYEACKAVIEYAKSELDFFDFRALVHKDNISSQRLCEKLGFMNSGEENDFIDYRLKEERLS